MALVLVFNSNFIRSRDTEYLLVQKLCLVTREDPKVDKLLVSAFRELTIHFLKHFLFCFGV